MIKISIITICYNAAETIIPTLQSVAAQSYEAIEYIVIDGASKDATLECVRKYMPSAIVLSEADRGLYDAMNKGIRKASGEYIWFLNAGDALRTNTTVEKLVQLIEEHKHPTPPDIIYGDTMIVDAERNDIALRRLRPPRNLQRRHFLKGMLVCHQAFVVARHIALPYDLEYRLSSDFDWCIRMMDRSQGNLQSSEILVNYLAGGLSRKHHLRSLLERFRIMRKHFGLLPTVWAHISFLFIRKR